MQQQAMAGTTTMRMDLHQRPLCGPWRRKAGAPHVNNQPSVARCSHLSRSSWHVSVRLGTPRLLARWAPQLQFAGLPLPKDMSSIVITMGCQRGRLASGAEPNQDGDDQFLLGKKKKYLKDL